VPPSHRLFVKFLPKGTALALGGLQNVFCSRGCGCGNGPSPSFGCGKAGLTPLALDWAELLEVHILFWNLGTKLEPWPSHDLFFFGPVPQKNIH
jgi:hypothetical protein